MPATGIVAQLSPAHGPFADPPSGLAGPDRSGQTIYGSVNFSGNSTSTICPGIYAQIIVSGRASLPLNPGTYIIEGAASR